MKKSKRMIWDSIYFRLVTFAILLILGINVVAASYLKKVELRDAEIQLEAQLLDQAEKILELKLEISDDLIKYMKYLDNNLVHISIQPNSELQGILEDELNDITYDSHIEHASYPDNRVIIIKRKNPMDLYAVVAFGDTPYFIKTSMDYSVVDQLSARIKRFMETTIIMCFLIFIVLIIYIAQKIKRVTQAANLVSSGRFDIELSEKGRDEIAELAKSFNYMVKELNKNEYLHKEFISSVSHEFKTPITSLKGYAVLAKSPEISEQLRQDYLDIIINESNRLSKLCTNLLRISELNIKSTSKHQKWFSLDEQIRDIIILLQPQWEEKGIDFDVDLEEVNFFGDQGVLWHLWNNLINNAVRYSRTGGVIRVLLRIQEDGILFQVKDNGIGIPEDSLGRLYEQFYTVDKSRNHKGNGLGLAIVKKIVDMYDGKIWVETKEGEGCSFYVEFSSIYITQNQQDSD